MSSIPGKLRTVRIGTVIEADFSKFPDRAVLTIDAVRCRKGLKKACPFVVLNSMVKTFHMLHGVAFCQI